MAKINANYEAMYILDPALSEEAIAALAAKFKAVVEANGTVSEIDEWGKSRLAYPIHDGPYFPDHRRRDAFPHRLQGPVRGS